VWAAAVRGAGLRWGGGILGSGARLGTRAHLAARSLTGRARAVRRCGRAGVHIRVRGGVVRLYSCEPTLVAVRGEGRGVDDVGN
jgi:hypothetical protein